MVPRRVLLTTRKTVKATEVRILKALDPGESYVDPAFLLVETHFDDNGEPPCHPKKVPQGRESGRPRDRRGNGTSCPWKEGP